MYKKILSLFLILILAACSAGSNSVENTKQTRSSISTTSPMDAKVSNKDSFSYETAASDRLVSYSANVDMNVDNLDESKKLIGDKIKELNGYILESSNKRIVANVPAKTMDSFIEYLDSDVGDIQDKKIYGSDITESYDDTTSRLDALKASRDQYMALVKKADKIEDILKIEKELERVNREIQSLELQKKRAETSVLYSKVTINLDDSSRGLLGWMFYGIGSVFSWLF